MSANPCLPSTQRWLQAVIVYPGSDQEAVASEVARREIPRDVAEIILPSKTLASTERVGVYRGMYLARLGQALEANYPALLHYLGEDRFSDLVAGYIQEYPSRSHTLNRLGDHLPDYIGQAERLSRKEFFYDLSRLELAMTEVFDEQESTVLTSEAIAKIPPEAWEKAQVQAIPALRLRSFGYPVTAFLWAFRKGRKPPAIRRKNQWVVIYRRNYAVRCLEVVQAAYGLLEDLVSGIPLSEAVSKACLQRRPHRVDEEQLFQWFQEWASEGLFRSVQIV